MLYMFEIRIKYKYFTFFVSTQAYDMFITKIIMFPTYYSPNFLCQKFTALLIFPEYI